MPAYVHALAGAAGNGEGLAAPVEPEKAVGAKAEDTWGSARACAQPSPPTLCPGAYARVLGAGRIGRGADRGEGARPAAYTPDTTRACDEGPIPLAEGSTVQLVR